MSDQHPNPNIPAQPAALRHPLSNVAKWLNGSGPLKIVAIGSSSTAGEGGIVPYPFRLEMALRDPNNWQAARDKVDGRMIDVINRGKIGDEAPGELKRMDNDVIAEHPALVIWQVGTNAAWKGDDFGAVAAAIDSGLKRLLRTTTIDVVLMDLQYAPAVLTKDKIEAARSMVSLISRAADANPPVNVFRRFELMSRWHSDEKISFDRMIDPTDSDRLHMSDWAAQRIAQALCEVIVAAALAKTA